MRASTLGCERRDGRELDLLVGVERVTRGQCGRVDEADDVSRVGVLDGRTVATEHRQRVLGGERLLGLRVGDDHAALEHSGDDAHECQPVAVRGVHARLHLEHDGAERIGDLAYAAGDVVTRAG
jgi:hypothetical protein